ncbi:MAG: hypothetical protein ACREJO_16120 [Phycisphaerales bacterium]
MTQRLGEILVSSGVLSKEQLDAVMSEHRRSHRPVGYVAQEMFKLPPRVIEDAWAEQYATLTERVDPRNENTSAEALKLVTRRQAWQFGLVPLRVEDGMVIVCTSQQNLARALRFAYRQIGPECRFVLASPEQLGEALSRHYAMDGASDVMFETTQRRSRTFAA